MRFFFHLHEPDGDVRDEEGLELPSVEEAFRRAIQGARSLIASDVLAGALPLATTMVVEDEAGGRAFELPFRDAVRIEGGVGGR
jgi:hypothetical protein